MQGSNEDQTGFSHQPSDPVNTAMLQSFSRAMLPALIMILLLLAGIVIGSLGSIASSAENVDIIWSQILSIHLVQIGAGMLLGMLCLFLGSAMSWFGITGKFSLRAEGAGAKLNIQSAYVGIVLLVGGVALIAISLSKSIQAKHQEQSPGDSGQRQPPVASPGNGLPPDAKIAEVLKTTIIEVTTQADKDRKAFTKEVNETVNRLTEVATRSMEMSSRMSMAEADSSRDAFEMQYEHRAMIERLKRYESENELLRKMAGMPQQPKEGEAPRPAEPLAKPPDPDIVPPPAFDSPLPQGASPPSVQEARRAREERLRTLEIFDRGKKTNEKEVSAFEQRCDLKLPEEYRAFLLEYNGGRPLPQGQIVRFLSIDAVDDEQADLEHFLLTMRANEPHPPKRLLPIAYSEDDVFYISCDGPDRGRIVKCDLSAVEKGEIANDHITVIAESFDRLMGELKEAAKRP